MFVRLSALVMLAAFRNQGRNRGDWEEQQPAIAPFVAAPAK